MPSVRKKRAQNKQNYLRNKEIRREASHTKYWANSDKKGADKKRAASQVRYWKNPESERYILVTGRTLRKQGHLPGHPPISITGRTLSPKGHPPIPIIGRTLIKQGQLPVCPPVLVIGGTPVRKGQQFA